MIEMSVIRVEKQNQPYTMILNDSIRDSSLSWKARGILCYLLSLPDDWQLYMEELESHATDGETALRSGIEELERGGYISKRQLRDTGTGQISGYEYVVTEAPVGRKPTSVKPKCGKSRTTNNELTKNELKDLKISPTTKEVFGETEPDSDFDVIPEKIKAKQKTTDPRSSHPAIQAVREVMNKYPPVAAYDIVIEVLENKPDKTVMQACYREWLERGYNPMSLKWLTDWYVNGMPQRAGGNVSKRGMTAADVAAYFGATLPVAAKRIGDS